MIKVLPNIITENKQRLVRLCDKYFVKQLFLFGSAVEGSYITGSSDLDFYVKLKPLDVIERGESLINLWESLEDLYQIKIDLVTSESVSNPILKKAIEDSKVLIYDSEREEILS